MDKSICNVIASGSTGNCEIYLNAIAIDMGIPFSQIKEHVNSLQLVLLSHKHFDHFNISTIRKLAFERPSLRFGCGSWMKPLLNGIKNVDVYEFGEWYDYGVFKVSIGKLYHDTENAFFRIDKGGYKIFRATDTCTLSGITAKDYDVLAVEHNYNQEEIEKAIAKKKAVGEFSYEIRAINTHLSEEAAKEFIYKNRKESSQVVRLHESSSQL